MNIERIAAAVEEEANLLSDQGNEEAAAGLRTLLLEGNEDTLVRFAKIITSTQEIVFS